MYSRFFLIIRCSGPTPLSNFRTINLVEKEDAGEEVEDAGSS